jgi:hypothetical protein
MMMAKMMKTSAWIIGMMVILGILTGLYLKSKPKDQDPKEKVIAYIKNGKVWDTTGKTIDPKRYSELGISQEDVANAIDAQVVEMPRTP